MNDAVLDEVERAVEQNGLEALSVRTIAKSIGVSHSAVFRHFSDKKDVLTAFATRSANRMADTINTKVNQARKDRKFLVAGLAYVNYARANPGPFRVIFREDVINAENEGYLSAMNRLAEILAIGGHGGGNNLALSPHALLAWSSVHGIATLCVDGSLSRDVPNEKLETLVTKTLKTLAPVLKD